MRKIPVLLAAFLLVVALPGCGASNGGGASESKDGMNSHPGVEQSPGGAAEGDATNGGEAGLEEVSAGEMSAGGQEAAAVEGSPDDQESGGATDYSDRVREFVVAYYGDWTFANGEDVHLAGTANERALPFIAEGSTLHDEFVSGLPGTAGYKGAATSLQDVSVERMDDSTYRAEVAYYGTQNTVTQEVYDQMVARGPEVTVLVVSLDADGYVVDFGVEGAANADDDIPQNGWFYSVLPTTSSSWGSTARVSSVTIEGNTMMFSGTMEYSSSYDELFNRRMSRMIGPINWVLPLRDDVRFLAYGGISGPVELPREEYADYVATLQGMGFGFELVDGVVATAMIRS